MTHEEFLRMMPGAELNALVQKNVMRKPLLKRAPLTEWPGRYIYDRKHSWIQDQDWEWLKKQTHGEWEIYNLRDYSTDISAAFEIAKEVQGTTNFFSIQQGLDMFWVASFYACGHYAKEATAPLAICKAALLAVMEC